MNETETMKTERDRLDALHRLNLLDTPPSESFDRISRMASQLFGLPIAAVSLTDSDRQWFKSRVGITHNTIPRFQAPCGEVAETTEVLILNDLLDDHDYETSVLAKSGIRFYAGAPLVTREGYGLGALCVLGTEPRQVTPQEISMLRDLAAMVMDQIELQHAFGRIDPISGLPNRHQFVDDLHDLVRDHEGEQRIAVMVDLARHDQIDVMTRVMGVDRVDQMIRDAARELRTVLGPSRTAYHVAATQFLLLAPPGVRQADYLPVLSRQFDAIKARADTRFVTTTVLGVMPFIVGTQQPEDVLRGTFSAVQDGRGMGQTIGLHSATRDELYERRLTLIEDFGHALEADDQLRLVFQPRIDLETNRCLSAEALLRWHHPRLGEISPAEFIPLVEPTALMVRTTSWVIATACRQLAEWHGAGLEVVLSINVAVMNLEDERFVEQLRACMADHDLPAGAIEIEVTEGALMKGGTAPAALQQLADAGIGIAIDDFGTGYSNLAYLQKLPAQVLKIDQTFVRALASGDERDQLLVRSIAALAQQLGYRTVAEGVETAAARDVLIDLGCEEAQGFFFARPMEAADVAGWMGRFNGATAPDSLVA